MKYSDEINEILFKKLRIALFIIIINILFFYI